MEKQFWTGWTPTGEKSVHVYVWACKTKLIPVRGGEAGPRDTFLLAAIDLVRLAFSACLVELDKEQRAVEFLQEFEPKLLKPLRKMAGEHAKILEFAPMSIREASISAKHIRFDYTHENQVRQKNHIGRFRSASTRTFPQVAQRFWTKLYARMHTYLIRRVASAPEVAKALDLWKGSNEQKIKTFLNTLPQVQARRS